MSRDCTKAADCPGEAGHWWDCLRGRAIWRAQDRSSPSPDAARAAERARALGTGDYLEPEPPPTRDEVAHDRDFYGHGGEPW